MLRPIEGGRLFSHDPALRGFQPIYRLGEVNHCPACGRTHWYVGRVSAECAFCSTAIALAETGIVGAGLFRIGHPVRYEEAA
ncbi:MAG TPA: hypothetical protein VHM92_11140 [Allosphingosinicella sp.]|nr:hypothetical protein [Allosphingosinicella sp.]